MQCSSRQTKQKHLAKNACTKVFKRFREGKEHVDDKPRSGRPSRIVAPNNIEWMRQMLLNICRFSLQQKSEEQGVSKESVRTIIHQDVCNCKICSSFVLQLLSDEQKKTRMHIAQDFIKTRDQGLTFQRTIITGYKNSFYQYDLEGKRPKSECSSLAFPTVPPQKKRSPTEVQNQNTPDCIVYQQRYDPSYSSTDIQKWEMECTA